MDDLHAVQQRLGHPQRVGRGHEHHVGQVVVDLQIMVVELGILLRVQHLQQGRGRVAPEVLAHLVDLVEQEQRVGGAGLLHGLHDLARHGADVGAPMAANLGLVAHAAQREADEVAAGGARHRLAQRGLADTRRAHQAQDRPLQLAGALLDGQILDDPLLDLLQAIVIGVEDFLGLDDVLLDLGTLAPRHRQHPVQEVAHHRGLGRHGAHRLQLLKLGLALLARFLGQLGVADAVFQLGDLLAAVVGLAQLLLDRLQLLVQIVLALGLLHLALDPAADLLFDLQHADLAFHEGIDPLQPLANVQNAQQLLLVGDLQRDVRGDRVGQLARLVDLVGLDQHLRRDLLVQLHILLELGDHRAAQGLQLVVVGHVLVDQLGARLEEFFAVGVAQRPGALAAFHQHLDGAVGQLQQLQHRGDGADLVDVVGGRLVVAGVLLRDQQNLLVLLHDLFQRLDRLFAAHEQRHDHVRKDNDVTQRKDGINSFHQIHFHSKIFRVGAGRTRHTSTVRPTTSCQKNEGARVPLQEAKCHAPKPRADVGQADVPASSRRSA